MGLFTLDVSLMTGGVGDAGVIETRVQGRGRTLQLAIAATDNNSAAEIYGLGIRYRAADRRPLSIGASAGLMLAGGTTALTEVPVRARGRMVRFSLRQTGSDSNADILGLGCRYRVAERSPLDGR